MQSGIKIPALVPPTFPTATAAAVAPSPDYFATPISSGNPLQVLQHPAFYFYTAACCSVQRQKRFEEALALEVSASLGILSGTDMNDVERCGEFRSWSHFRVRFGCTRLRERKEG